MTKSKDPRASRLSFGEAIQEVEDILERLEAEEIDIDDLAVQVKRAVELIGLCREKLTRTDEEVRELVAGLQAEAGGGVPAAGAGGEETGTAPEPGAGEADAGPEGSS